MIEFLRRVALPLWADGRGGTTMEFGLVALPLTMLLIGLYVTLAAPFAIRTLAEVTEKAIRRAQ